MSLLKRKQEKDRKAAEEAARLAEEKKLQDLAVHPLAKGGCGRDVRDAYLQGLVFAAIADDDKIDENERPLLVEIGTSLGMSGEEIEDTIKSVLSLDDDGKIALVEECVTALKGNDVGVKLFYAQFIQVWTSHEHDEGELGEYLGKFAEWTGVGLDQEKRKAILAAIVGGEGQDECLYDLAEWMGDESLKYFMTKRYGDISERLAQFRNRKATEEIAVAKVRDKQARIMQMTKTFCEEMRKFVADYVDTKRITRNCLLEISDELPSRKYSGVDTQKVFKNIGGQLLKRVEDLELPELNLKRDYHLFRAPALSQTAAAQFEQVRLITKETLWTVICLGLLKLDAESGPIEKWPIGKINTIIDRMGYFPLDARNFIFEFWRGVENVFGDLLGVKSVWRSLFSLTDAQGEKLSSWLKKRKSVDLALFAEYAHSIGVSRYCDAKTLRKLVDTWEVSRKM